MKLKDIKIDWVLSCGFFVGFSKNQNLKVKIQKMKILVYMITFQF